MAVSQERYYIQEDEPPEPGTLEHLDYLASMPIPEMTGLDELRAYLLENQVPDSFAVFLMNSPDNESELFGGSKIIDSRTVRGPARTKPFMRVSCSQYGVSGHKYLAIHGRPQPNEASPYDYTYDITLPVTFADTLSFHNPPEAHYSARSATGGNLSVGYRPQAFPEYPVHDPMVYAAAIKEAARDLAILERERLGLSR